MGKTFQIGKVARMSHHRTQRSSTHTHATGMSGQGDAREPLLGSDEEAQEGEVLSEQQEKRTHKKEKKKREKQKEKQQQQQKKKSKGSRKEKHKTKHRHNDDDDDDDDDDNDGSAVDGEHGKQGERATAISTQPVRRTEVSALGSSVYDVPDTTPPVTAISSDDFRAATADAGYQRARSDSTHSITTVRSSTVCGQLGEGVVCVLSSQRAACLQLRP